MAEKTVSQPVPAAPVFEKLEFPDSDQRLDRALLPGHAVGRFADLTNDVATGVLAVLELTLEDGHRRERRADSDPGEIQEEDRPLLSPRLLYALQRMAMTSARNLVSESEELVAWAEKHHKPNSDKLRAAA